MVRLNPIVPKPSPDDVRLTRLKHDIEGQDRDHRCGICNNGTGLTNPDCPGRRKERSDV